jgi:membrane protein implicated in regulation of membrane protease activity
MSVIWLAAAVVFAVLEAVTYQLVSIWFAGGCIVSLIALIVNPELSLSVQLAICVIVSAILLIATRPLVKKLQGGRKEPTNVDALIGKSAVVTETVDNVNSIGAARLDGKEWTARSADNTVIEKDSVVKVEKIDGVKLIVKK